MAAEPIFHFWGFTVTNSLLSTWIVMGILILLAVFISRNAKLIPTGLQNFFEKILETMYDLSVSVAGEKAPVFFPLTFTFFLFIICANWFGLIPGIGSIGFHEGEKFVPYLRAATSDLNTTLALAIVSMFCVQYYGFKFQKGHYLKKFLNFSSPIMFFVGILEFISDISKIISFSFRLFGNIFAGEVLLMVIAFLVPVVGTLPFFGLELFVGFIQALVFSMLTLVFLNVASAAHEEA